MRIPRIHTRKTLISGESLELEPNASRHLLRVLRLKPGDGLTLFNGDGNETRAELINIDHRLAIVHLNETVAGENESPLAVTLNQAVGRGERMDYSIQKAVELGVAAIRPIFTERTVVSLNSDRLGKRMQHWQGVIHAACEQSGRTRIPDLLEPLKLQELARLPLADDMPCLLLDPLAADSARELPEPGRKELQLVIGPEGGLSHDELEVLYAQGWKGLRLGPRILRTETAGMAALAVLQSLWGDL